MKVTVGLLLAALAVTTEAATMHRRHDQFHKRQHSFEDHPVIVPELDIGSIKKRQHSFDDHPVIVPELDIGNLKKRGDYGYAQAPPTDAPVPSYGQDAPQESPKKPKKKSTKCKPAPVGKWMELPKEQPKPEPVYEQPAAPAPPKQDYSPPAPAPAPAPQEPPKEAYAAPAPEPPKEEYKQEAQEPEQPAQDYTTPPSSNKPYGVTYSAFADAGGCIPKEQMIKDMEDIASKFQTVRVYSPECDCLETIGGVAEKTGLKMVLGTFAEKPDFSDADEQLQRIIDWGQKGNWKHVAMVVIQNESLYKNLCDGDRLRDYIKECKGKLVAAGCTAPVSNAEIVGTIQDNPQICESQDVVGVNIQPYFDGKNTPGDAGKFMKSQIELVKAACPNKPVYVLEAGWPNGGNANGVSVAGVNEQAQAVESMKQACNDEGNQCVYFSYNDEKWKTENAHHVEKNFGLGKLFGTVSDAIDNIGDKVKEGIEGVKEKIGEKVDDALNIINPGSY